MSYLTKKLKIITIILSLLDYHNSIQADTDFSFWDREVGPFNIITILIKMQRRPNVINTNKIWPNFNNVRIKFNESLLGGNV